jgi:hypothetical protein
MPLVGLAADYLNRGMKAKNQLNVHDQNLQQSALAMSGETLTVLEREVLEKLLAGDNPELEILRHQLNKSAISDREFTGTGFFTNFHMPPTVVRLSNRERATIGDVAANIHGINHGAGFVLFIDDGILDSLEGFTYDEPWPDKMEKFELTYLEERPRGSGRLHSSSVRDVEFGLKDLAANGSKV